MIFDWDETVDLRRAVGEAFGYVSLCWDPKPAGVFDSVQASEAVDELVAFIERPRSALTGGVYVPFEPQDTAGRMFSVRTGDGPVPLASCFDQAVAERIAELVNRHGLTDSEFDRPIPGK
jgi:hypothetical protein